MQNYQDLFKLELYENEEPINFYRVLNQEQKADPDLFLIPISIVSRIVHIGYGYQLKYCSLIDVYGEIDLGPMQLKTLNEELSLIIDLVNDSVLRHYLVPLIEFIKPCLNNKNNYIVIRIVVA
ncbi:hypothetical protein [Candidatus Pristimantibacillus sp. PTI5]|uniref:hypothetical protein n=1 Tax=Candidatus Pristimantibacillus sp. PTI5 TaxID=3400422 RepID=UPI003B012180